MPTVQTQYDKQQYLLQAAEQNAVFTFQVETGKPMIFTRIVFEAYNDTVNKETAGDYSIKFKYNGQTVTVKQDNFYTTLRTSRAYIELNALTVVDNNFNVEVESFSADENTKFIITFENRQTAYKKTETVQFLTRTLTSNISVGNRFKSGATFNLDYKTFQFKRFKLSGTIGVQKYETAFNVSLSAIIRIYIDANRSASYSKLVTLIPNAETGNYNVDVEFNFDADTVFSSEFVEIQFVESVNVGNIYDISALNFVFFNEQTEPISYVNISSQVNAYDIVNNSSKKVKALQDGRIEFNFIALTENVVLSGYEQISFNIDGKESKTFKIANEGSSNIIAKGSFDVKALDTFAINLIYQKNVKVISLALRFANEAGVVNTSNNSNISNIGLGDSSINAEFTLPFAPEQSGYSVQENQSSFKRFDLKGGGGRYVRDLIGNTHIVTCSWQLNERKFKVINEIYEIFSSTLEAFNINLIINGNKLNELQKCKCRFMPNTFKLDAVRGFTYSVSATLEVLSFEEDDDKFELFNEFGVGYNIAKVKRVGLNTFIKRNDGQNAIELNNWVDNIYDGYDNKYIPWYADGIHFQSVLKNDSYHNVTFTFIAGDVEDKHKRNLIRFVMGNFAQKDWLNKPEFLKMNAFVANQTKLQNFIKVIPESLEGFIAGEGLINVSEFDDNNHNEVFFFALTSLLKHTHNIIQDMGLTGNSLMKIINSDFES